MPKKKKAYKNKKFCVERKLEVDNFLSISIFAESGGKSSHGLISYTFGQV